MDSPASRPWEGNSRAFWMALAINTVWINVSEIFRYFIFVMPMMRELLTQVPNIAPMNVAVFLVWGIWDTIIVVAATTFVWFCLEHFGRNWRVALVAGTALWITIFVILWLALFNMSLASISVLAIALPLSWFELIVAAQIVVWSMSFFDLKRPAAGISQSTK
jgi:hypothetical protein